MLFIESFDIVVLLFVKMLGMGILHAEAKSAS